MKEDELRGLKFTIIFLSGIVVLLIGYIVNDVFFTEEEVVFEEKNSSKLLNLDNFSDYKNYDGTYASIKQLLFDDEEGKIYSINLGMDGKVYSGNYAIRKDITNVSNVVDIVSVPGSEGMFEDSICYMLTDTGEVYVYYMYDMMSESYEAKLVDSVSDVDRLIEFQYASMENASSSWGVVAILKDGTPIKLTEVVG